MSNKKWLLTLVLLLVMMTAAAQGVALQRGCRRGIPHSHQQLHRSQRAQHQPGGNFYTGDRRQLVVLVSFGDLLFNEGSNETALLQKWDKIFNQEGYNEGNYVGSVRDYFTAQSYGKFRLAFDLLYVHLDAEHKKYRSDDYDENSQYLVDDIMAELLKRDIDWSQYDWNGDKFVNQLLIVFAGYGQNDGGDTNTIWAHQWWLSEHLDLEDPTGKTYREADSFLYNGVEYTVDCYCAVAEKGKSKATFGTICHEYTHCFGMPDFYFGNATYVASWDLMDNGNYNGGGYCPAGYSAHERWLMGWLTPTELRDAATVTRMEALGDSPQAYMVRNSGYADEFYFIENRQQSGWDEKLPGSGILVFHIDYVPAIWAGTEEPPNHPSYKDPQTGKSYAATSRYVIFHANDNSSASYGYAYWAYPYLNNDELTDESSPVASLWHPNFEGTYLMSKPLTNMDVENGLASFDFMGGTAGVEALSAEPSAAAARIYDLSGRQLSGEADMQAGGIYIIRYADGQSRKVAR